MTSVTANNDVLDRSNRRRGLGGTMIAIAAVGVVVALVGTVVAWQLVGRLDDSSRQTLTVTIQTIDSIEDSLDLAADVITATTDSVDAAAESLDALDESFDAATGVVGEIDDLTEIVGPTLEEAGASLRQLEGVGNGIDDLLGDLSSIPFGPDYDPERGLGETIGDVATELEALPAEFEQTSNDLDTFETSIDELQVEIAVLASSVGEVSAELEGSDTIIDQYRTNLADARSIAVVTRDDLDSNVGLMRLILLIGGLNLALGQIVPFWLGRSLLRSGTDPDDRGGAGQVWDDPTADELVWEDSDAADAPPPHHHVTDAPRPHRHDD